MTKIATLGLIVAVMLAAVGVQAQTTNAWTLPGSGTWNTDGNWDPATFPNSDTSVAIFTNDYAANFIATLTSDVTLNQLIYNDSGAGSDGQRLEITGRAITFAGDAPVLSDHNNNTGFLWIHSTTRVSNVQLTVTNTAGIQIEMRGPLEGNGTVLITKGRLELWAMNSNFTGRIVVTNDAALDGRGAYPNTQWSFGDTNEATCVYGTGYVRNMRDSTNGTNSEPMEVYGVNSDGTIRFFNCANARYDGVVTLHTNGVLNISQYENAASASQIRMDVMYAGTLQDDGNNRNIHFVEQSSASSSGLITRASQLVFSGTGTYGGYTHISNTRDYDATGSFDMYLTLTNGNDRLPVGTKMFLGGQTNDGGATIGRVGASGILILAGANQEFAGLYKLGTGVLGRVVGGVSTDSILTLNIAGGTTNRYTGFLGYDNPITGIAAMTNAGGTYFKTNALAYQNNLGLVKKGDGLLQLSAVSNTFAGTTTVEAGTLLIDGNHPGGGAMTVQTGAKLVMNGDWRNGGLITVANGGTLGGTGLLGGIASSGTVSPGNSAGTLTSYGNVTLGAGATLALELDDPLLGYESDKLVMNGGALSLSGSPDLSLSLLYTPSLGDAFTIVSGMTGFDPGFDGTFSGKPDLGTFDVSGTTFQIDYTPTDITVTVVPEPHTLGLLGLAALGGLLRIYAPRLDLPAIVAPIVIAAALQAAPTSP
ncbi:MAG: autotransporter-associated beta strand repeat-containing protein, partial [Verrucomicrobia bacterium]|nr:autotransporter-associated beta strand repeat-containing protein [Verrucomicrobiota bacterium]